jgi:hypothetical protein
MPAQKRLSTCRRESCTVTSGIGPEAPATILVTGKLCRSVLPQRAIEDGFSPVNLSMANAFFFRYFGYVKNRRHRLISGETHTFDPRWFDYMEKRNGNSKQCFFLELLPNG